MTLKQKYEESMDQGVSCEHVLIRHPSEDAQERGGAVYLQLQKRVTSEECIQSHSESNGI